VLVPDTLRLWRNYPMVPSRSSHISDLARFSLDSGWAVVISRHSRRFAASSTTIGLLSTRNALRHVA
jgi:hypothetical protein